MVNTIQLAFSVQFLFHNNILTSTLICKYFMDTYYDYTLQ